MKSVRKISLTTFFLLVTALGFVGCKNEPNTSNGQKNSNGGYSDAVVDDGPGEMPSHESQRKLSAPWEMLTSVETARVYVDLSGSMAGYSRVSDGVLDQCCRKIRQTLFGAGILEISGAGFGETLDELRTINGINEVLNWQANRQNTCLGVPFDNEGLILASGESPALSIFITDGVASATSLTACEGCTEGSDIVCVAESLRKFVHQGQGLWVLGLKIPFKGFYYPEIGSTAKLEVPAGNTRPIYFIIGSPNVDLGRYLVKAIHAWSTDKSIDIETMALEVYPGDWRGYRAGVVSGSELMSSHFNASPNTSRTCPDERRLQINGLSNEGGHPRLIMHLSRSGGFDGATWAGRLPLVKAGTDQTLPPIQTTLLVESAWPPKPRGGRLSYFAEPDSQTTLDACEFCLFFDGDWLDMGLGWGAQRRLPRLLSAWSTTDDSQLNNLDKTLNLDQLLLLVSKRIGDEINTGFYSTLLVLNK